MLNKLKAFLLDTLFKNDSILQGFELDLEHVAKIKQKPTSKCLFITNNLMDGLDDYPAELHYGLLPRPTHPPILSIVRDGSEIKVA